MRFLQKSLFVIPEVFIPDKALGNDKLCSITYELRDNTEYSDFYSGFN